MIYKDGILSDSLIAPFPKEVEDWVYIYIYTCVCVLFLCMCVYMYI